MWLEPCRSSSTPANGFERLSDTVVRLSQPSFSGLSVIVAAAVEVHGPSHELRRAMVPNWFVRHRFTRDDVVDNSLLIPCPIAASDDCGEKTNARSLDRPSPLTSPATIGVNGVPVFLSAAGATENRLCTRV